MKPKLPSLEGFIQDVKKIYGKDLERVILFGSYARKEQTVDSDINIFVIVEDRPDSLKKKDNTLYDASYELTLSSGVLVHPMAVSKTQFDKWKNVYPLYREIQKDGVVLYDADSRKDV
ncbi:nucleotidyltransferase domain-containing protein [Mitsuokella multacida]